MGFLSQGLPTFASLLAQLSLLQLQPLRKVHAQEKASSTGSHVMGAGGGQPELRPALAVTQDTKQGCGESCSFVSRLLAFFLAF